MAPKRKEFLTSNSGEKKKQIAPGNRDFRRTVLQFLRRQVSPFQPGLDTPSVLSEGDHSSSLAQSLQLAAPPATGRSERHDSPRPLGCVPSMIVTDHLHYSFCLLALIYLEDRNTCFFQKHRSCKAVCIPESEWGSWRERALRELLSRNEPLLYAGTALSCPRLHPERQVSLNTSLKRK